MVAALGALAVAWLAVGVAVLWLGVRDVRERGRASRLTAALLWPWHGLSYTLVVVASANGLWRIELPLFVAVAVGGLLVVAGVAAIGAGFWEFRSEERLTGMRNDELVTSGVYRYSRHPQYLGIVLSLVGIGLLGRSAAAVAIAGFLTAVFAVYLPFEERFVERIFGERYRSYRERTPMLFGRRRDC